MTKSKLTDKVLIPKKQYYGNKYSSRNGVKIYRVIVHHWAGKNGGVERLVNSSDKASANYIILTDGTLISSVPEEYRAWTSSSAAADNSSITVEIQNSTLGPEWRVSGAAINTLTKLIADVSARYNFTPNASTVKGHRDFHATACPGPYVYPKLASIAAAAKKLIISGGKSPAPEKSAKKTPTKGAPAVPVLSKGSTGTAVSSLQKQMNKVFPTYSKLAVDGIFGSATKKVVREFQKRANLKVDGVVGKKTIANLKKYGVKI